jgi:hypothetical protein
MSLVSSMDTIVSRNSEAVKGMKSFRIKDLRATLACVRVHVYLHLHSSTLPLVELYVVAC